MAMRKLGKLKANDTGVEEEKEDKMIKITKIAPKKMNRKRG